MTRTTSLFLLANLLPLLASVSATGGERSYPVDCLPDRVVTWDAVAANPDALFGATFLPGVVLGPPGASVAFQGSFSVASLGFGGGTVLAFDDVMIEDRPGPDFIVFENAFFLLPIPTGPADPLTIFAEPAVVEVSPDGVQWTAFPHDAQALQQLGGENLDRAGWLALSGLAGLTPTFTGNWTVPDDPATFDPGGTGGISGAGGDAFDLATVGLSEARFVRITDAGGQNGFPGTGAGFDLDAVVVLHGRPDGPTSPDGDGDGLSDAAELALYGSDPLVADSDGDGVDDGREVAGCRDPGSPSLEPWLHFEPRVWVLGGVCTDVRWTFMGSGADYEVVRGNVASLLETEGAVDLGMTQCLGETGLRLSNCDADVPPLSDVFFYLVRVVGEPSYGRSARLDPRTAGVDCP